jgi:predicted ABC-type ATPase
MNPSQPINAPRALIIAGPNGSGKTTFAREFLPAEGNCPTFINADLIAEGLSPFRPEFMAVEASRIMLEHVRQMVAKREDFAVETTLAGRAYLRMVRGIENFHQRYSSVVDAWQVFDAGQWPPVLINEGVNS